MGQRTRNLRINPSFILLLVMEFVFMGQRAGNLSRNPSFILLLVMEFIFMGQRTKKFYIIPPTLLIWRD